MSVGQIAMVSVVTAGIMLVVMRWSGVQSTPSRLEMGGIGGVVAMVVGTVLLVRVPRYPWWECAGLLMIFGLMTWADFSERIIPNRLVLAMAVFGGLGRASLPHPQWILAGLTGVGCFLFFIVVHSLSHGGLGMGDVKFSGVMGFTLAWPGGLWALSVGIWAAAGFVVILMLSGRMRRGQSLALGPFLAIGGLIGMTGGWH